VTITHENRWTCDRCQIVAHTALATFDDECSADHVSPEQPMPAGWRRGVGDTFRPTPRPGYYVDLCATCVDDLHHWWQLPLTAPSPSLHGTDG